MIIVENNVVFCGKQSQKHCSNVAVGRLLPLGCCADEWRNMRRLSVQPATNGGGGGKGFG
jgi:hypothetical protein